MQDTKIPSQNARLYAIGDIHGRLDLLERAVAAIKRDVDVHGSNALTVTLGDYVDRGPKSREVIDCLLTNPFPTPHVALKGNHEQIVELFLGGADVGRHWCRFGGLETLHSYGVPVGGVVTGKSYAEAADRLREAMPAEHFKFLQSLKTSHGHGDYFLCHAGVRPGIALDRQSDEDLLWIRAEFLSSKFDFGKIVVHGHTPVEAPEVLPNRINIDTGAFATGRLTCIVLENGRHRFLAV